MAASIWDWSLIAANNATADADLTWAEGQAPSTVNNSARVMMQREKQFLVDLGGSIASGGSANAITVTAASPFAAYSDGQIVSFKATATNTAATTLNVNGIGAKSIRRMDTTGDIALAGGEIISGGIYVVRYLAAYNAAAGGWLLESSGNSSRYFSIIGNDTNGETAKFLNYRTQSFGTFPGPIVYLDREATSGTGFIGSIPFRAHNDLEAMISYVQLRAEVTSTANAAPLGKLRITAPDLTDFASFAKDQIILSGLVDLSNAGGGTAYGQIKFPAVQVPSANANTLDDYKETAAYGTLPTFSATGCTFSYALQTARATKIGDRVDIDVIMTLNTSGNTLTGNTLTILNAIPVAAGTDVRFEVYWTNSTTSYIKMFGVIGAGTTTMNVRGLTAAGTTVDVNLLANGALHATNGTRLAFNGAYFV